MEHISLSANKRVDDPPKCLVSGADVKNILKESCGGYLAMDPSQIYPLKKGR